MPLIVPVAGLEQVVSGVMLVMVAVAPVPPPPVMFNVSVIA